MDKTTDLTNTSTIKKRLAGQRSKPIKSYKSVLSQGEKFQLKSKIQKKFIQKVEITPLKTRSSAYKENSATKDLEPNPVLSKLKLSRQSTIKKKPLKQIKLKNRGNRGKSLGETGKKIGLKDQRSNSRPTLKSQASIGALKVLDVNKKMTPKSSHHSPQHSHRTPDSIRISQGQNLPNLTEKKTKIPEAGFYCKRFSLFDKNKPLYKDLPAMPIEKQDFPKLTFDNPFTFPSEASITGKSFQSIPSIPSIPSLHSIKSCDSLQPPSPIQSSPPVPTTIVPASLPSSLPPHHDSFTSPERQKPPVCPQSPPIKSLNPLNPLNPFEPINATDAIESFESFESFKSPTRLIKVWSSPESKLVKKSFPSPRTPKTLKSPSSPSRNVEPRAPRKTIADFESPGSFVFSVSSNSSDEQFNQDWSLPDRLSVGKKAFQRDEESQTDLIEFVADRQVMEGLKLIGKLSEIMNKSKNLA